MTEDGSRTDGPTGEHGVAGTGHDHPLAAAVSAHTGALPTAAVACLVAATVGGTTFVSAGSGMGFAGVLVVVAGLAAGGGARLAWSARGSAGRRRPQARADDRSVARWPDDEHGADGPVQAAGDGGLHEAIASTADRAWLRLAGAGAAFVLAGPIWVAGAGAGVGVASGLVASSLHAVILAACGFALVGAAAPEDLGWRGLKTAMIASLVAAVVPFLGAVLLGGGGGGALGTVTGWLGDVAWSVLLVFAWWNSPVGWGSTLRFATAMVTGLVLVGGLALGVSVALARLDLARLAPRTDREAVRHRLDGIVAGCRRALLGVALGIGLTVVLSVLQLPSRLPPAAADALLAGLGASALRIPLLAAVLTVWGGLVGIKVVVLVANASDADPVGWLPAGLGGGAVWLGATALLVGLGPSLAGGADDGTAVPLTGLTLAELLGEAAPLQIAAAVGLLSAVGAILTFVAFASVAILHVMGALEGPSRAGAIAVGGLAAAAIAAGVRGAIPLAVVATLGAGLVAWDAGAIGATMSAEIEHGSVAPNAIVARVAATAGMVVLGGIVALGVVTAVAGNLRPALQVPVLLGLVAALLLALWRLWALSSRTQAETEAEDAVTIGSDAIRRAPIDHPSATAIVAGLLVWTIGSTLGGFHTLFAFRIGAVTFLAVRVLLGIWITRGRDEPAGAAGGAAD
jgi:hypothetical protein